MRKKSASFMLAGEDVRLIEEAKAILKPKMGTLTNVQVIRMSLRELLVSIRKMAQDA